MGIFPDFIKWRGGNKWPTGKITATRKDVEDLMIPPDDAERKLDRVVCCFLPDKGCES